MASSSNTHECDVPDISLQEERSSYTCPVCGRFWYVVLEWDHVYNNDGTEYTEVYRCEFCQGWTRKGYLACDSCHRQLLNQDGSPRLGQKAPPR